MTIVSFKVSKDEDDLIKKYAKLHNMEVASFIRQAVIEKIENEHDLSLFNKVWEEEKSKEKLSHDRLKKGLGL